MMLVMSISLKVVSIAYVFCDPLRRSATRARSLVIFTRLSGLPGLPDWGGAGAAPLAEGPYTVMYIIGDML